MVAKKEAKNVTETVLTAEQAAKEMEKLVGAEILNGVKKDILQCHMNIFYKKIYLMTFGLLKM